MIAERPGAQGLAGSLEPARGLVPADALRLRFVSEAAWVPGRRQACCGVTAVDAERSRDVQTLWLYDADDADGAGEPRRLAETLVNPRHASPASDGAQLAFVADVDGKPQLCALDLDGGAVEVLTDLPQGVAGTPAWSPDGRAIAFTAPPAPRRDPSQPYRVDRATIRFDGIGIVDDALQEVYVLDVGTRAVRQMTTDRAIDEDPRFSPDGGRLLYRMSFDPDEPWTAKPVLRVLDVASGEARTVVGAWGGAFSAEWCRDGERIVFCGVPRIPNIADAYWHKHDLWTVDAAGGTPVCRTGELRAGVGVWIEYDQPTRGVDTSSRIGLDASGAFAYVSAQRGCDVGICRVALDGEEAVEQILAPADRTCFLRDVDADGALLHVASTLVDPPELHVHDGDTERRLTQLNDAVVRDLARPGVTKLELAMPDGVRLEGRALTPPGKGPFPTVLCVHGGPCNAYGSAFVADWHLLVGAGCAVVVSNFRGSGGYGDDFHHALQGRWGELGEPDHLATVDRAVELGIADPERLGVYGLSHGGFATCWLIGRTRRFRAAVAENPIVNLASAYATMDTPWWLRLELGASPAECPDLYIERSPLTYAMRCTTPLLLVVGEQDERCHPTEAEQFYGALKAAGCETEMLRLPGAAHLGSWEGPVPVRAAQDEALVEWFARHLVAGGDPTAPAGS